MSSVKKSKPEQCRDFTAILFNMASHDKNWDESELAKLISLFTRAFKLKDSDSVINYINELRAGTPDTIAALIDQGYEFSTLAKISMMKLASTSDSMFIEYILNAINIKLFNLKDKKSIKHLFKTFEPMNQNTFKNLTAKICELSSSKKICGRILSIFTKEMTSPEAISFIHEVITRDFFLDLSGSIKDFVRKLSKIEGELTALLNELFSFGEDGEVIEEDEDENGNLKDFVVEDDVISYESDVSVQYLNEELSNSDPENEKLLDLEGKYESKHDTYGSNSNSDSKLHKVLNGKRKSKAYSDSGSESDDSNEVKIRSNSNNMANSSSSNGGVGGSSSSSRKTNSEIIPGPLQRLKRKK